jgi:hypothetical protein
MLTFGATRCEFTLHVAAVLLGSGRRLPEHVARDKFAIEQPNASSSPLVTHITYRVR